MPTKRFRFPKARRLITAAQFNRVRKNGAPERGRLFTISVLRVEEGPFRAGFVTSRKIGGAVARNRVRRRLREIVRKQQHRIVTSVWIVTIAREPSGHASYAELEDAWLRLAKRTSILAP